MLSALGIAWVLMAGSVMAQSTNPALNSAALREVPSRLQRFIDDHTLSGAVTLVGYQGKIAALDAIGQADLEKGTPMRPDALFWIASMTKPITAVAVLMLQDEGALSVEDPVEKHLPEFKNQWLIEARTNDSMTLRRPHRPITIRDLLTHTSGIGEVASPRADASLAELVAAYSQQPLQFPPGSKWSYSNPGINTLGRIVEVLSGKSYADFLQSRLFDPLGMTNTTFWPTEAQAQRLAVSYQPKSGGKGLEATDIFFLKGGLTDRRRTAIPAGGLFSTAADYYRFCQMMMSGGKFQGKQLLSEESVKAMTRTQTGDIPTGFTDGMSFGFGFAVVKEPSGVTGMLSPGTFGHGGAYGTQAWVDPKKDLILILMIQRAKLPNADRSEVRQVFQATAASALEN